MIKKKIAFFILSIAWIVILYKTVQVMIAQPDSFFAYYYNGMLDDSWQSHFNVDLLVHSIVFSCWVFYREKSYIQAIIISLLSILFGSVFSLLYILTLIVFYKGNIAHIINGAKEPN